MFTGKRAWLWSNYFSDFFLFLKIDLLDLGTCHGTQRGTWTHKRFTGNNLDFSKLTEPGSLYRVHREEIDHPDLGICSRTQQDLGQSTMFTGKKNWLLTNFFFSPQVFKVDRTWVRLPGSQGREPGFRQTFFVLFLFLKIANPDLGTCLGTQQVTWIHRRFAGNKFDFS